MAAKLGDKAQARGVVPTAQQCAERLAYNDWSRHQTLDAIVHQFLAKAPFTNQLYHQEQVTRLGQQLQAMQAALTPQTLKGIGQEYRAAIEKAPEDWRLRWDYGKLLAEDLKQYDAAAAEYRIVQQYLPHSYIGHDALAAVLRVKGDLAGAISEYAKELAIKPTAGAAYYHLGWCHNKQGKTDLAADCYRKAIRFEPDYVPAYLDLGELLFKSGQGSRKRRRSARRALPSCRITLCCTAISAWCWSNWESGRKGPRKFARPSGWTPTLAQIRRVAEKVLGPGAL